MSASKSQEKRKKKSYYMSAKKHKKPGLEPGLKGFIVTCSKEFQCVKETYNLLNEFADELYGSELDCKNEGNGGNNADIDEEFAKEMESLKTKKRRFQQIRTDVRGILFINATITDPTDLATSIFENVLKTKQRKSRFICKMQPVVITCKASQNDMRKHLDAYLENYVKDPENEELTYKVISTIRHNNNVSESHVVWYAREAVEKVAPKWTGELVDPKLVISAYVIKNICCIGFLKNYALYKKYNIDELATSLEKSSAVVESKDSEVVESKDPESELPSEEVNKSGSGEESEKMGSEEKEPET